MEQFIWSYPEFESEESLHRYYLAYEGLADDESEELAQFWRQVLMSYQQQVAKSFRLRLSQVMKDLTLQQRLPVAIPALIQQQMKTMLVQRAEFEQASHSSTSASKESAQGEEESAGLLYSVGSYLGNKLYENTVGYYWYGEQAKSSTLSEDPSGARDVEYVNVEYLDRVATGI